MNLKNGTIRENGGRTRRRTDGTRSRKALGMEGLIGKCNSVGGEAKEVD